MGGRGSSGGGAGGGGGFKHGQTATVSHPLFGTVKGKVNNPQGGSTFTLKNAKASNGMSVPKNTLFTGGSLSNNPQSGF